MAAQDTLIQISDSQYSVTLWESPADAVNLVNKYPARFGFVGPDPRVTVATIVGFQQKYEYTPLPILTGAKSGNAALASLISGLVFLGLVVDHTTA